MPIFDCSRTFAVPELYKISQPNNAALKKSVSVVSKIARTPERVRKEDSRISYYALVTFNLLKASIGYANRLPQAYQIMFAFLVV